MYICIYVCIHIYIYIYIYIYIRLPPLGGEAGVCVCSPSLIGSLTPAPDHPLMGGPSLPRLPPTPFRQDPQTRKIVVCPFNLHNKLPRLIFASLPAAKIIENRCRVVQNRQKSKFARLPCSSSLLASFYDPFGVQMSIQNAYRNW